MDNEGLTAMKIAVLIGGLRFDSQRRIMNGILEKAVFDGTDVYIFTCDSWTYSSFYYTKGETAIFSLPDLKDYDGVILHGDTVYDKSVISELVKKIREARIPCISLNVKYPGMLYMGMDNANGIYGIVEHLLQVHRAKHFAFISGPEENMDSTERWESFRKALADNKIPFDNRYFYYGDYHPESGKKAVGYFYDLPGAFPDAIVAANDEMALGAFYKLKELGYEVPEQVLLTGYDNAIVGRNHSPRITSVERPETELGAKAYEKLRDVILGKEGSEETTLKSHLIFTESCGCHDSEAEPEESFRMKMITDKLHVTEFSEIVKSSSADFTGAPTFEQLLAEIRRYIKLINPDEFYMCMCVVEDSYQTDRNYEITGKTQIEALSQYAPEICIPLIYRRGEFENYGRFPVEKFLPDKYTVAGKGRFYTVVPLHYQDRCYGYCVIGNSRLMMDSELFHLFIMNINNALENLRKQSMLNSMVHRLNRMWIYDTLTEVFNRAGFFKFAPNLIHEAIDRKENLFILFLDLDGLKSVNDRYGHDEGDAFIKAMGMILRQLHGNGELVMRYGGDEFVVMSKNYTDEKAAGYIRRVERSIDEYNMTSGKEYKLGASMGYSLVEPEEDMKLEDLIEVADQEMYKVKKAKKERLKNQQP